MYVVIKTSQERIEECGSLFEAARGHWRVDTRNASKCTHAVVTLRGCKDIKAVYTIDKWYPSTLLEGRHVFAGASDEQLERMLVGKTLNKKLTVQGQNYPILYVKESELLEV